MGGWRGKTTIAVAKIKDKVIIGRPVVTEKIRRDAYFVQVFLHRPTLTLPAFQIILQYYTMIMIISIMIIIINLSSSSSSS